MCGFAGDFRFSGHGPARAAWETISAQLKRRGPDDEGYWENEEAHMVFRRLSIIDLSRKSHQPMLDGSQQFVLVFNGELYNFKKLRSHLRQLGHRFISSGDAEVVLHSLMEWNTSALEKFNGMFALAFYDIGRRRMLLARDHAGIKPIYYGIHPKGFVFGSQLNNIRTHPWFKGAAIDKNAMGLYLRLGYIPAPFSIYQNTRMLEPGAWISVDFNGSVSRGRYFEFSPEVLKTDVPVPTREEISDTIQAAVSGQMVADVTVGSFLSGGIDSPLVTALAGERGEGDITALTVGFPGKSIDEQSEAVEYAKRMGVRHKIQKIAEHDVLSLCQKVAASCHEPFADYSIFPSLLITQSAREFASVMLSGDGGDELFWGYPERFGSVISVSARFRYPPYMRYAKWYWKKYLLNNRTQAYLRQPSIGNWYFEKHCVIPPSFTGQLFPELPSVPTQFKPFEYRGWDRDEAAYWLRANEYNLHLTKVLLKVDRASMYNSLEVRVPLLDKTVVELSGRLNWKSCLSLDPLLGKRPLRKLLKTKTNYETQGKKGFECPMGDWLRGPLKPLLLEYVMHAGDFGGIGADAATVSRFVHLHLNRQLDLSGPLWLLLSFKLWSEQHDKQSDGEA